MVVACDIGGAGEAGEVDEGGAADVVGDGFKGELEGVAEEAEELLVTVFQPSNLMILRYEEE